MADDAPAALKQADIHLYKCAQRASQLASFNPIVTYWCQYWVVNQILAKQLHNTDGEILEYTTNLMDALEQTKNENANEEAITDDVAGQAYIEQFAQQTLDRAQRVVKANKVTPTTAGTFDAAVTFFTLVNIWGPPDSETMQKIKYAKWNATRILKAIKEGRDPNESNPQPEELPVQPALDPNDPDVQELDGPKPASVEDVPDDGTTVNAAQITLPETPAALPNEDKSAQDDLTLPNIPSAALTSSSIDQPPTNLGYFDSHEPAQAPSPMSPGPASTSPSGPQHPGPSWVPTPSPPVGQPPVAPLPTDDLARQPPSAPSVPPTFATSAQPTPAFASPPIASPDPNFMNITPAASIVRPPVPQASVPAVMNTFQSAPVQQNFVADDAAMSQAQKHAKWAISALNFEDVPTAVRELRKALQTLGAS